MGHAGVFGVENWAVEVDQDGMIGDPKDDLDSIRLRAAADVEAPVDLFPKHQHRVVCFDEEGLFLGGWQSMEAGGIPAAHIRQNQEIASQSEEGGFRTWGRCTAAGCDTAGSGDQTRGLRCRPIPVTRCQYMA